MPIQTAPAFSIGNPTKLFDARCLSAFQVRSYDVTPDGKRFLFIKDMPVGDQSKASAPPNMVVVLNWFEELKRLVPVN